MRHSHVRNRTGGDCRQHGVARALVVATPQWQFACPSSTSCSPRRADSLHTRGPQDLSGGDPRTDQVTKGLPHKPGLASRRDLSLRLDDVGVDWDRDRHDSTSDAQESRCDLAPQSTSFGTGFAGAPAPGNNSTTGTTTSTAIWRFLVSSPISELHHGPSGCTGHCAVLQVLEERSGTTPGQADFEDESFSSFLRVSLMVRVQFPRCTVGCKWDSGWRVCCTQLRLFADLSGPSWPLRLHRLENVIVCHKNSRNISHLVTRSLRSPTQGRVHD